MDSISSKPSLPTGKDIRVFGFRGSQIGDTVMAAPLMAWCRKRWPDCYIYWQVARKHSHAVPLWYNHPLIDQLVISDGNEGMGPRDIAIAQKCNVVFNVMPEHPEPQVVWPNVRSIWAETFLMAGLPLSEYHSLSPYDQRAHLAQWFEVEKRPRKTIALWPCAQYGQVQAWHPRNASYYWYERLVAALRWDLGLDVYQMGHPNDFPGGAPLVGERGITDKDLRHLSFMDQIKFSLGCGLVIGTDSGAGLAIGAYEQVPQISLLTNHYPGHTTNLTAFSTNSPLNRSIVGVGSADNISIGEVIKAVKEMV